jgi:hypothetical protein
VGYPDNLREYFDKLFLRGINLKEGQKRWYYQKWKTQQEDMTREFPSYPEEAFSASQEGYWYATQMKELHEQGHITDVSYDRALMVHTAWDLGQADFMAVWFFQVNRQGEINVIDYFQAADTPLSLMVNMLQQKGYTYGSHIWPHDANARDRAGITFVKQAGELNLHGTVLDQHLLKDGINKVRTTLSRCWFDQKRCKEGIKALEAYQKKWSPSLGGWSSEPNHNFASHGSDAFRYLCAGVDKVSGRSSIEDDYKAVNSYFSM